MLTEFNFHAPSFVVAGRNSVHQTGELLNQWGAGKNIMVVCGNKTYSLGLLNSLLDSKGLSHSTGSIPSSPDHSCEITVFRMIPCLRPKSLTDSQHGFQLLCLLLVHF